MDWLFREDEYIPAKDKDTYLDKSIGSMLKMLSGIRRYDTRENNGLLHKINASVKLVSFIVIIFLIALSGNIEFILIADVCIFLLLPALGIEEIKRVLLTSAFAGAFTLIMLLPSIISGNILNGLMLVLRVLGTAALAGILSSTTLWRDMTKSLKLFFVPDLFIFIFDITIKYIYLLGETAVEMLYAIKMKSLGRNNKKYMSIIGTMGNLFLKSRETGEEMYSAMECRGFTGQYEKAVGFKLNKADLICALVVVAFVIMFLICNQVFRG